VVHITPSYPTAGQQRHTNQATLNHNLTEIETQGKTRGQFRHNTPAEQHRPSISAEQHHP